MSPIKIAMFAKFAGGEAGSPGQGVARVALEATRGPNPAAPDPNAALFTAPNTGVAELTLRGLNAETYAGFTHGKKYVITIAEDDGSPTSASQ